MNLYKTILLAADFNPDEEDSISGKAVALAKSSKAALHIIHVIEYPYNYGAPYEIPTMIEWQQEIGRTAKRELDEFAEKINVPEEHRHLLVGIPKSLILETAEKIQADLIVLGSHGRHGLNLFLLGSTANGVLHGATCDVLAVRVNGRQKGAK